MNIIKNYIFKHFNELAMLSLFTFVCGAMLLFRVKLTDSFFYLFLVWNLFLGAIPFFISFWTSQLQKPPKIVVFLVFAVWLLFLPNAPYILTDLIHLRLSSPKLFLFDLTLISLFSISGLYFYCISVQQMQKIVFSFFSEKGIRVVFALIPFLCGFGIYLGRFLRFNSWDLMSNPSLLISEIVTIVLYPIENKIAWITTLGFGVLLTGISWIYKKKHHS